MSARTELPAVTERIEFATRSFPVEDDGYRAPAVELFECSLCAALVEDTAAHLTWHELLAGAVGRALELRADRDVQSTP